MIGMERNTLIYRCHFTRDSRIVGGQNLTATTFLDAIDEATEMLASQPSEDRAEGFELWDCATLLYTRGDNLSMALDPSL
jgi:hypothetical protein